MGGQEKEFLKHYNEFKDKIFNYFWYRVNFDRSLAEDLTSEAFLKAFENFDSFDRDRPFQAWIYAIARNHLLNYYRTQGREVTLIEAFNDAYDPAGAIEAGLELERVMDCIKGMDPYHRDVLLLRLVDGFGNKEIADLLGKEEGAVRTQISRALHTLRKTIKKN